MKLLHWIRSLFRETVEIRHLPDGGLVTIRRTPFYVLVTRTHNGSS